MDPMDDLIAFLRARLHEDEELARQAEQVGGAPSWDRTADVLLLPGLQTRRRLADRGVPDALQGAVEAHAARHDPARVLAEVDAQRRIVELHEPVTLRAGGGAAYFDTTQVCRSCEPPKQFPETAYPCATIRLLALPFAGHPDYRNAWRP